MSDTPASIADPIILPFSFTVPSPFPAASGGLPRLAGPAVYPANGWPKGA